MSDRYRLPDPKCRHARRGYVTNQPGTYDKDRPHALTSVCDRDACIQDAIEWVKAFTREAAVHVIDADPKSQDSDTKGTEK